MKTFYAKENCTLKEFTSAVYPQGAFCLNALLRNRDVIVNGTRVKNSVPLKAGDEVVYYTTPAQEAKPSHTAVYEDENVYIADKQSGVSSEGLTSELASRGEIHAVHRLDTNTEGLIAFAKNREAEKELLCAFRERTAVKKYIALCKNNFKNKCGTLTAYLVKDSKKSEVKIYSSPSASAEKIITEYRVAEDRGDIALVEITLHTGKTHQIRAHMAFIGCPVLGDGKYGDGALNKKYAVVRQRLVAKYLTFSFKGKLSYLNGRTFKSSFGL